MKKQKTIEVSACDLCINEDVQVWACANCSKEACRACCFVYEVSRSQPPAPLNPYNINLSLGAKPKPDYTATFCADCSKNDLPTHLLRAGFQEGYAKPRGLIKSNDGAVREGAEVATDIQAS